MASCPKCCLEVNWAASRCPHCHADIAPVTGCASFFIFFVVGGLIILLNDVYSSIRDWWESFSLFDSLSAFLIGSLSIFATVSTIIYIPYLLIKFFRKKNNPEFVEEEEYEEYEEYEEDDEEDEEDEEDED